MESNKDAPRDHLGNIIFPEINETIATQIHRDRYTYVFHFKDKLGQLIEMDWNKFLSDEERRQDLPVFTLIDHRIFNLPKLPASNEWIIWRNKYDHYLNKYFQPVFRQNVYTQQFPLKIDIHTIQITQQLIDRIIKFIGESRLTEHTDFIIYLIAKIQQVYANEIDYYDSPKQRKKIIDCPKETEKLYTVLDRAESKDYQSPQVDQVTFRFDKGASIKLMDNSLISVLLRGAVQYFDDGGMKNWRKQLKAFPEGFTELQQPNEFRTRICKVLHNFFKDLKTFNFGNKETTDEEIYAIAGILDFAHVRFYSRRGELYDYKTDKDEIKQIIRTTIARKKVAYQSPVISAKEYQPDLVKLHKYFDPQFLSSANPFYTTYDIGRAFATTDRFNQNHLLKEVTHVLACLHQMYSYFGHQFECLLNKEIEDNQDYKTWMRLLDEKSENWQIGQASFSIQGESARYEFKERISLDLLKRALKQYVTTHRFEFEMDFYESTLQVSKPSGAYGLKTTGKLNLPPNRFFPKFVAQCYQFLLGETPPGEFEYSPSERYYRTIGALLLEAGLLGHNGWDEDFVVEQVQYWHSLTQT